ncbi:MAG TPA: DMT family transporter [Stellaceae bacterium]
MANLAHPGELERPRLFNLNSVTAGVAAGCLMSLGAPLSFAAARGAMLNDGMNPGDLILMRYLVAGPLMLPVLFYFGVSGLAGLGWRRGIILAVLGGPSFTLLQTAGLAYAPLAHGGVITPAAVAIISTVLAAVMLHERLGSVRLAGSALLIAGIVLIGWDGLHGGAGPKVWLGDLLFLAAAVAWALFSVLVRRWRVDALRTIAVVSVLSAAVTVPGYLAVFGTAHIVELPRGALLAQGLLQGCMHGVLATLGFTHAIRVLGVSRAVFFAAVVPVVSVLIGIPLLHEIPSLQQWLGVGVATVGLLATILLPSLFRRVVAV